MPRHGPPRNKAPPRPPSKRRSRRASSNPLTAGDAHMPRDRGPRRADPEIMALGLAGDQPVERFVHRLGAAMAQQLAQLDLLVVAETAIDRPRRRHPDAVAAGAEIAG